MGPTTDGFSPRICLARARKPAGSTKLRCSPERVTSEMGMTRQKEDDVYDTHRPRDVAVPRDAVNLGLHWAFMR